MDSNVGLAIQFVGIVLLTVVSFFMRGSIRNASLKYWAVAWTCLCVSLAALFIGFKVEGSSAKIFYSLYFFGEYSFGLLLVAGCRYHANEKLIAKRHLIWIAGALLVAILLPYMSADFNDLFMVQATIMAAFFDTSFCLF